MKSTVSEWMVRTGVKFGTSGARGLATAMTDLVGFAYTRGFLTYLIGRGEVPASGGWVAVGGDLRPSTDRILSAVARGAESLGFRVLNGGKVPSPAVALAGFERGIPSIMVTGSHIPDDRNGIKFNKPGGEILKDDEAGMMSETVEIEESMFDGAGWFVGGRGSVGAVDPRVAEAYVRRYREAFAADALAGLRLGVYQHSAVGRDVLVEILRGLGAEVEALGRSERFIPVDTEAVRPEDVALARQWAAGGRYDAIVSADGDSDRPLVSDEHGEWLRGDVAGVLCARHLAADSVSTPVSSNTVLERCGWFREIRRTRIGSPYVAAAMLAAAAEGCSRVVGYEANGGFLIQSDLELGGRRLRALPTRDAVIVILSVLLEARRQGGTVSQAVAALPSRHTASDRLKEFPPEATQRVMEKFGQTVSGRVLEAFDVEFGDLVRAAGREVDRTDGIRVTFGNGEILHLRPSGNAPEFRCYAEAPTMARAEALCRGALERLERFRVG